MKTPQEIAAERFVVVCADDAYERGWLSAEGRHDEQRWNWGLFDTSTSPPTLIGEDGGEPEDQRLVRDWKWVPEALNKYAVAAREEGRGEGIEQAAAAIDPSHGCADCNEHDGDRPYPRCHLATHVARRKAATKIRALASQPKPEPAAEIGHCCVCSGCMDGCRHPRIYRCVPHATPEPAVTCEGCKAGAPLSGVEWKSHVRVETSTEARKDTLIYTRCTAKPEGGKEP